MSNENINVSLTLVEGYIKQKDYKNAEKVLAEIGNLCETSSDRARYCYLRGRVCYESDYIIIAKRFYNEALRLDSGYAEWTNVNSDIELCDKVFEGELLAFHETCGNIMKRIKVRCAENKKQEKLSDEDFAMRLGIIPATRKIPGVSKVLGIDDFFGKYDENDKKACLKWLEESYGITDVDSFFDYVGSADSCISPMAGDVLAYLNGRFDANELDGDGRYIFEMTVRFVRQFAEYLPKDDCVHAWDIGEKIGFARQGYRCGILSNSEYVNGMSVMSDEAKRRFSGWEEYMTSLIFGAALYMFNADNWSVSSAVEYISALKPLLLDSDLPDTEWNK